MRGRSAHQFNEVVVFLRRESVFADVADQFRIDFGGGIKAKGDGDMGILQIAIDGFGDTDDSCLNIVGEEILSEDSGVGVRVVAANHDKAIEVEVFSRGSGPLKLLRSFDFGAARAEEIKTSLVSKGSYLTFGEKKSFPQNNAAGAIQKTQEFTLRMELLQGVEKTRDDVMAARGLSAGEDGADFHGRKRFGAPFFEGEEFLVGGFGEEFLDGRRATFGLLGLKESFIRLLEKRGKLGGEGKAAFT